MFQTNVVEKIKKKCSKLSPPRAPENRAVYEKMFKNIAQSDRPQMTIWRMRFACRIRKATNTHFRNVWWLLFFTYNNGCTNALLCYVKRTLPVFTLRIKTNKCIWKYVDLLHYNRYKKYLLEEGHKRWPKHVCVWGGEVTAIIVRDHELLKIACLISRQTGKCLCTITTLNFMKKQTCVIYSQFIPQCLSG